MRKDFIAVVIAMNRKTDINTIRKEAPPVFPPAGGED
jgi:hypothetical protein